MLNKEKLVFLVALTIAAYILVTAFSGQGRLRTVPDELPGPDEERVVPPMTVPKLKFLEHSFEGYWETVDENIVRNPWARPRDEVKCTVGDFRLLEPRMAPMHALVPPPSYAPPQARRAPIWQVKPPAAVDEALKAPGPDEESEE